MSKGIFSTRDLTRVTHRAKARAERREPKRGMDWRRDDARAEMLRDAVAERVAEGLSLSAAAADMGISKSYAQRLFAEVRAAIETHSPGQTE